MGTWNRLVNSIRTRGLKRTLHVILTILEDHYFDIKYKTNTIGQINSGDLDISSENKHGSRGYGPTRARPFTKLITRLDFPSDSVFVDFGSGKGRTLILASRFGFKKIVGVEFSHKLCEEAKKNLSIYRKKTGVDVDVEIVESDVVDYEVRDDENVFFLFDPFDSVVMAAVLKNINISLEKKPRKIWLIYHYPKFHNIIVNQGNFVKFNEYILGGNKFNVYVNNSYDYPQEVSSTHTSK